MSENETVTMRTPFPAHQVSKLPKPTKQQTDEVRADYKKGTRCEICGGWHHPKVIHVDYVGHAALTDRLLDVDHNWSWEPVSFNEKGLPAFDGNGGLWIKLTVLGVTRYGYGDAQGKEGGDAIKECIGDALRNAAMRFGAALDLWHKGDLHVEETPEKTEKKFKSVPNDVWDSMDEATKRKLEGVAEEVKELIDSNIKEALEILATITDADEKTALWSRFDSKERSAIKAASTAASTKER